MFSVDFVGSTLTSFAPAVLKLVSFVLSSVTVTCLSPALVPSTTALLNAPDKSAPLSFPSSPLLSDLDSTTVISSLEMLTFLPV